MSLDRSIDDLYRLPLGDFVRARNALAKSLTGDEARRVRALAKPTVVPWAINQLYWRARPVYQRLLETGVRLRAAQIGALEGKRADVREAADKHRRALADAVAGAERLAAEGGSHPDADALMRTLEALSLAAGPPDAPGRLTHPLQPAGFEALSGVTPKDVPARVASTPHARRPVAREPAARQASPPAPPKPSAADIRAAKKAEAERRRREADVRRAEAALERARERAQREVAKAEARLREVQRQ